MPTRRTNDEILEIARGILASDGLSAVSFDAIARSLGRSKQAVLYWYPTKHDLLVAMFLPWLEAEADAAVLSIKGEVTRDGAVRAFVTAIAAFHFDDLERFRMMYLLPQTIKRSGSEVPDAALLARIHPVTDRMYGVLAGKLGGEPTAARREAFAIHAAVMGVLLLFGLADSVKDPLKHAALDMVDTLIATLTTAR